MRNATNVLRFLYDAKHPLSAKEILRGASIRYNSFKEINRVIYLIKLLRLLGRKGEVRRVKIKNYKFGEARYKFEITNTGRKQLLFREHKEELERNVRL